jgi:hypothetical protein
MIIYTSLIKKEKVKQKSNKKGDSFESPLQTAYYFFNYPETVMTVPYKDFNKLNELNLLNHPSYP